MLLLFYSEVGGRTQFRFLCRDAGGETEQAMLNETVPPWVLDVTVQVWQESFIMYWILVSLIFFVLNSLRSHRFDYYI